eukprot:CAMPEP_0206198026 /NCGR_PEP_ID=MMETSP0166-20121206/9389_1 /ASSEMBLY_ACC=CAM_ASM_000260 /TAXON_ID=95228 /ORGANISM="Vannella robusta, Strain DIVA3 518/3/11/1/6" /LENGTH=200 /DNA_ID=CAMNT_0053615795 /DNA_START=138 /DNA_END=737 /DNA_ORIENTATION=+
MTFLFGGCLEGEIQYEVDAEFQLVFVSDRDDGGSNVELHYKSAVATAHTDDAVNALTNTCGSRFAKEQPRNVLGCLFCPIRYDIYLTLEDGIGDGIACQEEDRPTQYEESKYYLIAAFDEGGNDDGNDDGYNYYNTFTGTFTYFNEDDDLDDDFFDDEDDEIIAQDDDDEFVPVTTDLSTFTYTRVYNTFSNSPGTSDSG